MFGSNSRNNTSASLFDLSHPNTSNSQPLPAGVTALDSAESTSEGSLPSPSATNKVLIQCLSCYRAFKTQAQFGQHSRICNGGEKKCRKIMDEAALFNCTFLVKSRDKLEIKTRFLILCDVDKWNDLRKSTFSDAGVRRLLTTNGVENVRVTARKKSKLPNAQIIANFVANDVPKDNTAILNAKTNISNAVDTVRAYLSTQNVDIRLHACNWDGCNDIVVRDTEGYCSRHRQQKYHKSRDTKGKKARKAAVETSPTPPLPTPIAIPTITTNTTTNATVNRNSTLNAVTAVNSSPFSQQLSSPLSVHNNMPMYPNAAYATSATTAMPQPPQQQYIPHHQTPNIPLDYSSHGYTTRHTAPHMVTPLSMSNTTSTTTARMTPLPPPSPRFTVNCSPTEHFVAQFMGDLQQQIPQPIPQPTHLPHTHAMHFNTHPHTQGMPSHPQTMAMPSHTHAAAMPSPPQVTTIDSFNASRVKLENARMAMNPTSIEETARAHKRPFSDIIDAVLYDPNNSSAVPPPYKRPRLNSHHSLMNASPVQYHTVTPTPVSHSSASAAPQHTQWSDVYAYPHSTPQSTTSSNTISSPTQQHMAAPQTTVTQAAPATATPHQFAQPVHIVQYGGQSYVPATTVPQNTEPNTDLEVVRQNLITRFMENNVMAIPIPDALSGVPLSASQLRNSGLNVVSVGFDTRTPQPQQILAKDQTLVVLGNPTDAQRYLTQLGERQLQPMQQRDSSRLKQFCQELATYYLDVVPVPPSMVGRTLQSTPQVSRNGMNVLACNFQPIHPSKLATRRLQNDDLLLCYFPEAPNKNRQIHSLVEDVQRAPPTVSSVPATSSAAASVSNSVAAAGVVPHSGNASPLMPTTSHTIDILGAADNRHTPVSAMSASS